jgi:hypothetical protein
VAGSKIWNRFREFQRNRGGFRHPVIAIGRAAAARRRPRAIAAGRSSPLAPLYGSPGSKRYQQNQKLFEEKPKSHHQNQKLFEHQQKRHQQNQKLFEQKQKRYQQNPKLFEHESKSHQENQQLFEHQRK